MVSSISFKKWTKTCRIVVKTNSFVRYLEEFTTWQFSFEIKWLLQKTMAIWPISMKYWSKVTNLQRQNKRKLVLFLQRQVFYENWSDENKVMVVVTQNILKLCLSFTITHQWFKFTYKLRRENTIITKIFSLNEILSKRTFVQCFEKTFITRTFVDLVS